MRSTTYFVILAISLMFSSCKKVSTRQVEITTDYGKMVIELYDSTPKHRDNFIKLVESGFYNELLFHRVKRNFMIQGGDPDSKNAEPRMMLGQGGPGYTIDHEIGAPHIKGALSAARLNDNMNPEKKSSGSQFFIVQGTAIDDANLDHIVSAKKVNYNETQRKLYKEKGGFPMLDGDYTVFGMVVEGLDVIDKIAAVDVDIYDRPKKDIKMKIRVTN